MLNISTCSFFTFTHRAHDTIEHPIYISKFGYKGHIMPFYPSGCFTPLEFIKQWKTRSSRYAVLGRATDYGLGDWEIGVRVPLVSRFFTSPCGPDRLWGPPNLLYNGYSEFFRRGKAAWALSWPLTSNQCRDQENVGLYIHSPTSLYGVLLN
jgi:hypothetical protein